MGSMKIVDNVAVPPSDYRESIWIPVTGYTKLGLNMTQTGVFETAMDLAWSHDGVNVHGKDLNFIPSASTLQKAGVTDIKAPYVRVIVKNTNATNSNNMTAYTYLY